MSAVLQSRDSFQPMREADLDAVVEIENRIYEFPWTEGNFRDSIRAGYSCWVARSGDAILGYSVLLLAAGEGHLLNLSIDTAFQRQGYGGQFLIHLMEAARREGTGILFLEVRPTNTAAISLYTQHGFRQIGVRREYYPARNGRENALILALEL
jgi:ribosomal-protein-alanine N-acetyltransferase